MGESVLLTALSFPSLIRPAARGLMSHPPGRFLVTSSSTWLVAHSASPITRPNRSRARLEGL